MTEVTKPRSTMLQMNLALVIRQDQGQNAHSLHLQCAERDESYYVKMFPMNIMMVPEIHLDASNVAYIR